MNRLVFALAGAVFTLGLTAAAQEQLDRVTVPLTDPARPVTLEITLFGGSVTINASDGRDVVIEARGDGAPFSKASAAALRQKMLDRTAKKQTTKKQISPLPVPKGAPAPKPAPPVAVAPPAHDTTGLTRLPRPTALEVEEAGNVVKLKGPAGQRIDLSIQVPVRTNLRLKRSATGEASGARPVTVQGLDGDLEITTEAGPVTLTDVAGSIVAHSTRGTIIATVKRVTPDRPMAFTSYSGNVDVTLPASLKANLILQSDRGDVFTNFGVQLGATTPATVSKDKGYKRPGRQPIRASVNGGGPDFELRTFAGSVYLRKMQ